MASSLPFAANPGFSRRFSLFSILAATALVLSVTGCHQEVKDPNDPRFIVAETKTWTITRAQLDTEVAAFLRERKKTIQDVPLAQKPMLETDILNNMVIQRLVLAKAATLNLPDVAKMDAATFDQLKSHFPTEAEFQAQLKAAGVTVEELKKRIHEGTIVRQTLETEALKDVKPTDAEINAFYMQNKDKLVTPDKVRASRIIVMVDDKTPPVTREAKKKVIEKAHARVLKGEDFARVAGEVTEDQYSKSKGGDVGYFQKGENEPAFDAVAFSSKPGAVSAVFQSPMGYQFLKVTDVHPGGVLSIAQARDNISAYLLQIKQREAVNAYAKKLLSTSGVTFHLVKVTPDQLPGAANKAPAAMAPATNAAH